jgi:hypothetical protein
VVNEYPAPDIGAGVNFNASDKSRNVRNEAREPAQAVPPAPVCATVQQQRVQSRITGQDFPSASRRRVALKDAGNVFSQALEHGHR